MINIFTNSTKEAHFENIQSEIILRIDNSKNCIKIAMTWFTNHDIFEAIIRKLKDPKFQVDLIVLNDRINNKNEGIDFQKLIDNKGNFYYSNIENMVHHKFCIIDDKIVITGSYNWTYYAENRNWENILITKKKLIVQSYIEEFKKIILNHNKVDNVEEKKQQRISENYLDIIKADYLFHAKTEEKKGNDIEAAKVYTEILRLNNPQKEIIQARKDIISKYNNQSLRVSPYEIGIHFKNGYTKVIPLYAQLPYKETKTGSTVIDNQTAVRITIQKKDIIPETILQFSLSNIKSSPQGTAKVEITLDLNNQGVLKVFCKEINGYDRSLSKMLDITTIP